MWNPTAVRLAGLIRRHAPVLRRPAATTRRQVTKRTPDGMVVQPRETTEVRLCGLCGLTSC
ncbi:hypothetical protein [Alicyclobacillus fructus]|uniref:hypothetical protein n=1 Tax=Alicyclobacillus fructus TaxID=2816082 RepID=UPI001A8E306B|nr:hypothetical protein [Alicyclobacillus fructus]